MGSRRFVWGFLLLTFHCARAALPMLSSEMAVSLPGRGETAGQQHTPAVAASASGFLIVWVDQKSQFEQASRLLALRTDRAGQLLDATPLVISSNGTLHQYVSAASDGSNYYVVWSDSRLSGDQQDLDLFGTFVSSNGIIASLHGVVIQSGPSSSSAAKMIAGAEGFFVLWSGGTGPRGARISSGGTLLDPGGMAMDLLPHTGGILGSDGSNYIYVAKQFVPAVTNYATFRWRIAAANGSTSDAAFLENSDTFREDFALAFNGSRFLLASRHWTSNTSIFLHPDGTYLGPGPEIPSQGIRWNMLVAGSGQFVLLTSDNSPRGTTRRYSGLGVPLATNQLPFALPEYAEDAGLAAGGNLLLMRESLWNDEPVAAILGPDGAFQKQFSLQGPNAQRNVAVATDGADYLAAWDENRDGSNMVYAVQLSSAGLISAARLVGSGRGARIAYAPGFYLVVWIEGENLIRGRRLSRSGTWIDELPLTLMTNNFSSFPFTRANVASSGTNFLITWDQEAVAGSFVRDVHGTVVPTNGNVTPNSVIHISPRRSRDQYDSEIVFDGTNYVVGWTEYDYFGSTYRRFITGWRKVSPDGVPHAEVGSTAESSTGLRLAQRRHETIMGWNADGLRVATLSGAGGTNLNPATGLPAGIRTLNSLAVHGSGLWVAGNVLSGPMVHVEFAALDSNLVAILPAFHLPEASGWPRIVSNGTNLLCGYESPLGNLIAPATPRVRLRLIFPETIFGVSPSVPPRLTGRAAHSFVIDQSANLLAWQPYQTNRLRGLFDFAVPAASPRFYRMRWLSEDAP